MEYKQQIQTDYTNGLAGPETRYYWQEAQSAEPIRGDSFIEDLIHGKTQLLKVKLEVLATHIQQRLEIRGRNHEKIDSDNEQVVTTMNRPLNLPPSGIDFAKDMFKKDNTFENQLFDLAKEKRNEDVECWRDVSKLMMDFLNAWEAHEQAKAKAIFLNNV